MSFDPGAFLATVGVGRTIVKYRKQHIVFSQGDPADAIFYIQEGKVKLAVVSKGGKEAVLGILGVGDFFGEGCLTGQPVRLAKATTLGQCSLMRISRTATTRVLRKEAAFAEYLPRICCRGSFGSKRIWWTSCSIQARSAWPGYFCYWHILARR